MNITFYQDNDSKESGMNLTKTKTVTVRFLVALVLATAGLVCLNGIAEAATCLTCHAPVGSPNDIRPVDAAWRNITTGGFKGSHEKHISSATMDTNVCLPCHQSEYTSKTAHMNGLIELTSMGYSKGSTFPQSGNPTLGTCAAASCHDDGKYDAISNDHLVTTATWGTTLPACTACHAAVPTTESHTQHLSGTAYQTAVCADCHKSTVQSTSANSSNHRDGKIDVFKNVTGDLGYPSHKAKHSAFGTCATAYCHSSGQSANGSSSTPVYASTPPTWGGTVACGSCHATTSPNIATGSHTKHLTVDTNCGNCHTGSTETVYDSTTHVNGSINVGVGTYTAAGTPGNGYGTCSTTTCHDNGKGVSQVTPTWGTVGVPGCSACHAAAPATQSHTKHLSGTLYHAAVCADCHNGTVQGTTANATTHLDGRIDVFQNITGDLGYPSHKAKGSLPYKTCATAYCHSSGQSADGASATPVYAATPPTWGGSAACGTCHATTGMSSGSHAKHLSSGINSSTNCGSCHANATLAAYSNVTHVDGHIDVTAGLGYAAADTPGNGYSTCTNAVACHNNGKYTAVETPVWGASSPAACTACHALIPTTGSHTKHLSGQTITTITINCATCHTGYTQGTTADATNHLNGTIQVNVGGYSQNGKLSSVATLGACATSACHSNIASYKSATWGGTSTGCGYCHDAIPTSGSHTIHIGGGDNYSFTCDKCHGHNGTGPTHIDGSITIVGSLTYLSGGAKTCSTTLCHSDGKKASPTYKTTPNWTNGTFVEADRCTACHDNSPTSGAHSAHAVAVAIHYDDIYSPTGGKMTAAGNRAGHGNASFSTTISCNMCHWNTVTVGYNDKETVCSSCHGGSAPNKGSLVTASVNKVYHVNGVRDVFFAGATVRSKAQLQKEISAVPELNTYWSRNGGFKTYTSSHDATKVTLAAASGWDSVLEGGTCSSVACHNGNSITWSAPSISCDKCHTALP